MKNTAVKKGIRSRLMRRPFLIRIILSVMAAAMIPVVLTSTISASRENEQLLHSMQAEVDAVALSLCEQFETCMNAASSMVYSINEMVLDSASEGALVSEEVSLIRQLKYLKLSLSFVQDIGYYDQDQKVLYLSTGKYPLKYYAGLVFKEKEEACASLLGSTSRTYLTFGSGEQMIAVYLMPLKAYSSLHRNASALFVMSASSLSSFFRTYLPYNFTLLSLSAPDGTQLYSSSVLSLSSDSSENALTLEANGISYMLGTGVSSSGFRAQVCADKLTLSAASVHYSSVMQTLLIFGILVCILLLFLLVFVNYMPVYRTMKKVLPACTPADGTDEFSAIGNAFEQQTEENQSLSRRMNEQRSLLTDYIYERLLSGLPADERETELVKRNMSRCRILCARSGDVQNTDRILRHNAPNAPVYVYEHYLSGYIVLICRMDEKITAENAESKIRSIVGDIPLGLSDAGDCPEEIRKLFLQASDDLEGKLKSKEHFANVQEEELQEKTRLMHATVMQYIDGHYLDFDISLTSVADAISVSEYTAGRLLKNIYGENFRHIINLKRLEHAKELLLASDKPINEISVACGFSSPSYFIKVFRDFEGLTPAAYREEADHAGL